MMSEVKYPKQCPLGGYCPKWRLPASQAKALKACLLAGATPHGELAETFGISRQRVVQLSRQIDAPTGREVRSRITAARNCKRRRRTEEDIVRAAEQAREARETRLRVASELWCSGASMEEIGEAIGITKPAAGVYICVSRRSHPGLFPYRRTPHHSDYSADRQALEAAASKLWKRGKPTGQIAAALGSDFCTIKYLSVAARRRGRGDLFPTRRPRRTPQDQAAKRQRVSRMWKAGKPVGDIARAEGMTPRAVHLFVCHQRHQYPELFPYRQLPRKCPPCPPSV